MAPAERACGTNRVHFQQRKGSTRHVQFTKFTRHDSEGLSTAEVPAAESNAPPYACLPSAAAGHASFFSIACASFTIRLKGISRAGARPRRGRGRRSAAARGRAAPPHRLDGGAPPARKRARLDPAARVLPPRQRLCQIGKLRQCLVVERGATARGSPTPAARRPDPSRASRRVRSRGISSGMSWSAPRSETASPAGNARRRLRLHL